MAKKTISPKELKKRTISVILKIVDLAFYRPEEYRDELREGITLLRNTIYKQTQAKPAPKVIKDQLTKIVEIQESLKSKEADAPKLKTLLTELKDLCEKE